MNATETAWKDLFGKEAKTLVGEHKCSVDINEWISWDGTMRSLESLADDLFKQVQKHVAQAPWHEYATLFQKPVTKRYQYALDAVRACLPPPTAYPSLTQLQKAHKAFPPNPA
jgi:hypothetical protein